MTSTRAPDTERVILVDASDAERGIHDKLAAHREGLLHRAVSVFVTGPGDTAVLQRRAGDRYHSGGLWSNAACTHPQPGESVGDAAARCLREEMALDCRLSPVFALTYYARLGEGMVEHEYDHVFVGYSDEDPVPNPHHVAAWRRVPFDRLTSELAERPDDFTAWLPLVWGGLLQRGVLSAAPGAVD
jgi:isopentenyl-diphosphate delta-isomerase